MGIQPVQDVTLIRHAYVRSSSQKRGVGSRLLAHLQKMANTPVLIGTWADARWAIGFYEKHGFHLVRAPQEKDALLKRYWTIPERQAEVSVVLADAKYSGVAPGVSTVVDDRVSSTSTPPEPAQRSDHRGAG